jgi:hypothetical protein
MRSPLERLRRGAPGPPDFIGVGTIRSGTWWWFGLLVAHPEIAPPRGRRHALHHFERFCTRPMRESDIAAYHARFPRRPGLIRGEWTGRYMLDPWTPPLLALAAPDALLLVLLSDPIERYRAIFARRRAALGRREQLLMADVVERRCHASQLARLHRYFDPARILVLQLERCQADAARQYRRTLEFLGARDRAFLPRQLRDRRPPAAQARDGIELWPDIEDALHAALDPEVERLATMLPDFEPALWPNFAHLAPRVAALRRRQPMGR